MHGMNTVTFMHICYHCSYRKAH